MVSDLFTNIFCRSPADGRRAVNHLWEGFGSPHERKMRADERSHGDGSLTKEWAMIRLTRIFRSERGATAIEYALVAALISIAALAAFTNPIFLGR